MTHPPTLPLPDLATITHVTVPYDRDDLGRLVRDVWITWAREQPHPKPSWLTPWEELPEQDREVDRRIGATLAAAGILAADATRARRPRSSP